VPRQPLGDRIFRQAPVIGPDFRLHLAQLLLRKFQPTHRTTHRLLNFRRDRRAIMSLDPGSIFTNASQAAAPLGRSDIGIPYCATLHSRKRAAACTSFLIFSRSRWRSRTAFSSRVVTRTGEKARRSTSTYCLSFLTISLRPACQSSSVSCRAAPPGCSAR